MAETKSELEARNRELEDENARLRGQLSAAGATAPWQAPPFVLTEGDRQELETKGYATIGGRLLSTAEVREILARTPGQEHVEIGDVDAATAAAAERTLASVRRDVDANGIRGVDYVWPSVGRGVIDPAVAGTPGINGPAADATPLEG